MIPVDHTLVNAYFTDNEKSIVCTEWQSNTEDEAFRTYTFNADENNRWWRALLKHHIDIDSIHENTVARIRNMRQTYEDELVAIARANNELTEYTSNIEALQDSMLDYFDKLHDNESLFKLKLKIFEREKIKQNENRELKANLRKAKTLYEILEAYSKF